MKIVILDHPRENEGEISWAALECRQRLIDYSLDNLKAYLDGNYTNIVNEVK